MWIKLEISQVASAEPIGLGINIILHRHTIFPVSRYAGIELRVITITKKTHGVLNTKPTLVLGEVFLHRIHQLIKHCLRMLFPFPSRILIQKRTLTQ